MAVVVPQSELHRVVSTAIIYKGSKYLLLKRSEKEKAFPGKWTVAGGGLSPDDYINSKSSTTSGQWYFAVEKSLRREVKEETNLVLGELHYLCDLVFVRPDGIPVVVLSYFGAYKSGKVKLEDEGLAEAAWVTVREAEKCDLIDGILEEIEMVDMILRKKQLGLRNKELVFQQLLARASKK